ncbi:MAG: hypothetical protein RL687_145 [Candidatus Parcubacteria bacterium]|jgi:hypothetical protein
MAENKRRKGSRKYKPSGAKNSTGHPYKDGVDRSNTKFHSQSKGYGRVNVIQKRGHLGK